MPAAELIGNVTLASPAASIGWTSIPQSYKHLFYYGQVVSAGSGVTSISPILNQVASTGSNYVSNYINITNSGSTVWDYGTSPIYVSNVLPQTDGSSGAGVNAGTIFEGWIGYYTLANNDWGDAIMAHKMAAKGGNTGSSTFLTWAMVELEVVTAINAIQFTRVDGTNWGTGSNLSLYGLGS